MAAEGRKARAMHERRDSMERRDKKFIMHGSPTWEETLAVAIEIAVHGLRGVAWK